MSDVNKMLELADWLKHMQGVNASVAHIPEMAGHIANLKEWESAVRSLDVAAGPQADVPQTARMQEVSRIVRMLLTNDAFPEYRMDDDRGLEESEYVDFAMRVLSALSTSTACGYSEQPWTGAQPLYAAQPQADGVREALDSLDKFARETGQFGYVRDNKAIRKFLAAARAALAAEEKPDVPQTPAHSGTYLGYKNVDGLEMHCANAFCPHPIKCRKGCANRTALSAGMKDQQK